MALPLDVVQSDGEHVVRVDDGWLIYPEPDRAGTGKTCRSYISICDIYSMETLWGNLRSFPTATGSPTAGTGCTLNKSLKVP